jgi:uncharacterized membrane protein
MANGLVSLGDLPGGIYFSSATGVSGDGSVIVGKSIANDSLFPSRAFRWTAAGGMEMLPDVPGVGPTSFADGVSEDGMVVVGSAYQGSTGHAFVWDAIHGSRSLAQLLNSQGANLTGWNLDVARAATYDGSILVGVGTNMGGRRQVWIAGVDPDTYVPEPSAITIGLIAFLLAALSVFVARLRCRPR